MQISTNTVLVCVIVLLGASVASAQAPSTGFLGQLQAGVGGPGANASAVSGCFHLLRLLQTDLLVHNSLGFLVFCTTNPTAVLQHLMNMYAMVTLHPQYYW